MDDFINRDEALNCFHDWLDEHGDLHTADECTEYEAIELLPSAEVIPINWIQKYSDDWLDIGYAYENPIQGMLNDWREEQSESV